MVPINTCFKGDEAAYVLRKSGARVLFTVGDFLGIDYVDLLRAADAEVAASCRSVILSGDWKPGTESLAGFLAGASAISEDGAIARIETIDGDDVADIMFTSGTTGRPKGVLLTHAQSLRAFESWGAWFGIRDRDRDLIVPPFFHCFGYKAG